MAMPLPPGAHILTTVADLFRVLAHPNRVRILSLLHERECDVSELTARLGLPPANVSQHLAVLRAHHVVAVRRAGTHVFYSLRDPRMAEVINRALDILDDDVAGAGEVRRALARARLRSP
jgi:ArsR family transcriptional regulator